MTKEVVKQLQNYRIESNLAGKAEVIYMGRQLMEINQLRRHSMLDLLVSTLSFIGWEIWLGQLVLLVTSILLISRMQDGGEISSTMQMLTGMMAVSVLFFMDELFKSFIFGMWELEETFKYDLRQHTMLKILIFGLVDMGLILILSLATSNRTELPLLQIMVYLLVPYNIICILLFSLITMWRNYLYRHLMWLVSGLLCLACFVVSNMFQIYQLDLFYWWGTWLVTGVFLFYLLHLQLQKIRSEEDSRWTYE